MKYILRVEPARNGYGSVWVEGCGSDRGVMPIADVFDRYVGRIDTGISLCIDRFLIDDNFKVGDKLFISEPDRKHRSLLAVKHYAEVNPQ